MFWTHYIFLQILCTIKYTQIRLPKMLLCALAEAEEIKKALRQRRVYVFPNRYKKIHEKCKFVQKQEEQNSKFELRPDNT